MLRKYLLTVLLVVLAVKYGFGYLMSERFQVLADEKKWQWTCHLNDGLAEFHIILSDYNQALALYDRLLKRCPKTPLLSKVEYRIAECYDKSGRRGLAKEAYAAYVEKYPDTNRARLAARKLLVMQ